MRATIARKFGLLGVLFTLGGLLAIAAFYFFIERTRPEAGFVYLAAQLRLSAQELLLYADDVAEDGVGRDRMWAAVEHFERDLTALEKGGPALRRSLPAAPPPVLDEIDAIKRLWTPVRQHVALISARQPRDPEALQTYGRMREDVAGLITAANTLIAAYDDHMLQRRRAFLILLAGIAGLDLVLLVVGWWITRRHVLRPVALLAQGAQRVAVGNFSSPVTVTTRDELAELAASFNQMAQNLSRSLAEVRESEERFSRIFHSSPAAIVITRVEDGRYIDVNEAALRDLGYLREELIGHTAEELNIRVEGARGPRVERLRHEGILRNLEGRFRTKDGRIREALASMELIEIAGQTCILSIVLDITERKQLEERLRQAQKIEATGELAGGVAHDFNNRLTAIMGESELLEGQLADGAPRERARRIRNAAQHAAILTRQLLAFGRRQQLKPQPLDVNDFALTALERMRGTLGTDIRVMRRLASGLPAVEVDPGQLDQVMANLIVNAREAMPTGGTLTLETRLVETWVEIALSDTGEGISADVMPRIFDPFFSTRPLHTGLGLSTAHGIVSQSGGHLLAESRESGTTFRVLLPRSERPVQPAAAIAAEPQPGRRVRVLVAEDEADVRQLVQDILGAYGYEVIAVRDGEEALRVAAQRALQIDLLLTDVVMPGIQGPEVARRLQQLSPSLKVLYMSGYAGDLIAERGLLPAGTAFLQKPFTVQQLVLEVRRVLGLA